MPEPQRTTLFTGVGVAIVTLFDADGEVDATGTADLADRLVGEGVRAVVVAGSTGEAAALSADERVALLEAVKDRVGARVPVIAGTGAASARQAAAYTIDARKHGADAILALSPPGSRRLGDYYAAVAGAAGELPLYGYHFPRSSLPGIPVEELTGLPLRGIKDSSGDPERLLRELTSTDLDIYTGAAMLLAFAGPLGCPGAILALANVDPALCARAFAGDPEAQLALTPLHLQAREDFPYGLKRLLADRYGTSTTARL
ncbi:MAG: dihydrodipicolinate synthase family protein [Streptosporangiaceae bacterium]